MPRSTDNGDMLDPTHPLADLLRRDTRFPLDAYVFVFDPLRHAQQQLGLGREAMSSESEAEAAEEEERHITGQQLCDAIRHYAMRQYGGVSKSGRAHSGGHP